MREVIRHTMGGRFRFLAVVAAAFAIAIGGSGWMTRAAPDPATPTAPSNAAAAARKLEEIHNRIAARRIDDDDDADAQHGSRPAGAAFSPERALQAARSALPQLSSTGTLSVSFEKRKSGAVYLVRGQNRTVTIDAKTAAVLSIN